MGLADKDAGNLQFYIPVTALDRSFSKNLQPFSDGGDIFWKSLILSQGTYSVTIYNRSFWLKIIETRRRKASPILNELKSWVFEKKFAFLTSLVSIGDQLGINYFSSWIFSLPGFVYVLALGVKFKGQIDKKMRLNLVADMTPKLKYFFLHNNSSLLYVAPLRSPKSPTSVKNKWKWQAISRGKFEVNSEFFVV